LSGVKLHILTGSAPRNGHGMGPGGWIGRGHHVGEAQ